MIARQDSRSGFAAIDFMSAEKMQLDLDGDDDDKDENYDDCWGDSKHKTRVCSWTINCICVHIGVVIAGLLLQTGRASGHFARGKRSLFGSSQRERLREQKAGESDRHLSTMSERALPYCK